MILAIALKVFGVLSILASLVYLAYEAANYQTIDAAALFGSELGPEVAGLAITVIVLTNIGGLVTGALLLAIGRILEIVLRLHRHLFDDDSP